MLSVKHRFSPMKVLKVLNNADLERYLLHFNALSKAPPSPMKVLKVLNNADLERYLLHFNALSKAPFFSYEDFEGTK